VADDRIELVSIGRGGDRPWTWGRQHHIGATPAALADALDHVTAEAVLVLDAGLPLPDDALLDRLLAGPADAWHGGLRLGLVDHPRLADHVNPLWMFNAPVDADVETTSWRLSLRALLVRATVLDQLGHPDPSADTLAGAGLELGLRWIRSGAIVRHVPDLVPDGARADEAPSFADELRLVRRHHGRVWAGWALQRALVTRGVSPMTALRAAALVRAAPSPPLGHYSPPARPPGRTDRTVSVIVPTIDRYPYLEPLLHQLAGQTVGPHQVIVADQTPLDRRRHDLAEIAPDLPVTVLGLPRPGQCTSRNAALAEATGELVLFVDDDDEIPADLLEGHLERLVEGIDASSGGVDDATAGPPPEGFRHRRVADVFPTNNTMLRRSALARSGLFDPAYDRGARADHDLGMRLHRAGAVLVYDPSVQVFHHHAPAGGLRTHGARAVTRAGSRRSLTERHLPGVTEQYLALRYFTPRQRREARRIRVLALLTGDGPPTRRLARAAVQLALLPASLRAMRATAREARAVLADRPAIPALSGGPDPAGVP
jgi:GT2 family glycosyltransferase